MIIVFVFTLLLLRMIFPLRAVACLHRNVFVVDAVTAATACAATVETYTSTEHLLYTREARESEGLGNTTRLSQL